MAWAFAAALGTTLLAFGPTGALAAVAGIAIALLPTASAVLLRDVPAAGTVLHLARLGLLGCMLAAATRL